LAIHIENGEENGADRRVFLVRLLCLELFQEFFATAEVDNPVMGIKNVTHLAGALFLTNP